MNQDNEELYFDNESDDNINMLEENVNLTKPFLKWAGGKLRVFNELRKCFPKDVKRFVEPFLGAGSLSLNIEAESYIVNDVNKDLISVWRSLKERGDDFINDCRELFATDSNIREVYNSFAKEFNESEDNNRRAVLFVYLNRHCFNGLCRYNSKGKFNVPFGRYDKPYFPQKELEAAIPKTLKFDIRNTDYKNVFADVGEGDTVYCDPPYMPLSASANFSSYSSGGFELQDQIDLAKHAREAANRGAIVVISNHYNWYSHQIYSKMFNGKVKKLSVSRTISSKIDKRNPVDEIMTVFNNEQ
jgi:DNA adenine methylase